MRAIRIHRQGEPDVLQLDDVAPPRPGPDEVLVAVAAAGVNFVDTYQRSGAYELELPTTPGLEGVGRVVEVGAEVRDVAVGDRVGWMDHLGSYAELTAVPVSRTVPVPDTLDDHVAAASLLQGATAQYLVTSTHELRPGETALVFAAAGGVGRLLVQMARQCGARVLACTSTEAKAEEVRRLGADRVILYRDEPVVDVVRDETGGTGVDVVYDSVGADTIDISLAATRVRGIVVLFGQASGPAPPIDPAVLFARGSLYLTRPKLTDYIATTEELRGRAAAVLNQVADGSLDVHTHGRFPLGEAAAAHHLIESGETSGKLLLEP